MWLIKDDLFYDEKFPYRNFVSIKKHGNLKDDNNRRNFCEKNGINFGALITAEQVHDKKIAVVNGGSKGQRISLCDGLITQEADLPLGIFTADCMPIFFGSRKKKLAGIIHAGWKGLLNGIVEDAVSVLRNRFQADPGDIVVSIGPHIQKCCYKVSEDIKRLFGVVSLETTLDLSGIAVKKLSQLGVKEISVNPHCSCCEPELFFSYRRGDAENRMLSLVMI